MMFPVFVYKSPGNRKLGRKSYRYVSVNDEIEMAEKLAEGWFATREEAIAGKALVEEFEKIEVVDLHAAPTRAELEQMAKTLNIKYDGRTSDKKLNALIDEVLSGMV